MGELTEKERFLFSTMHIEYCIAKECKQPGYGLCIKCGECGRKFEAGFMVDNGGTTPDD